MSTQTATKTKIQLRDYQKQMVAQTYNHVRAGERRILLIALMGLGKSYTAAWMIRDAIQSGKRCLFLVPLKSLVDQMCDSLRDLDIHTTALQGSREVDYSAPCLVATIQTIDSRIRQGRSLEDIVGAVDFLVADESHVTAFTGEYDRLSNWVLERGGISLGLTATPWRLKKKTEWLGQKYDCVVEGPQPPEAVRLGAVLPCRGFTVRKVFDFDSLTVSRMTGDYSERSLSKQATQPEALTYVVDEWLRLSEHRPTIMVGATVEQAKLTAAEFESKGIAAAVIIGSTSLAERFAIFEQVKSGEVKVICSVGCLTAGVDLKFIGCILYVRATKSKSLFYQTAGRGCRTYAGKHDFLLLDFGDNLKKHGSPMGWQVYDISKPEVKEQPPLEKECFSCGALIPQFAQFCPECGESCGGGDRDDELSDLDLSALHEFVDKETRDKIAFLRRRRRDTWLDRGAPDSPINDFVSKYGHIPPTVWVHRTFLQRRKVSQKQIDKFLEWLESSYHGNSQWQQQWVSYHLNLEFGTDDIGAIALPEWHETLALPPSASWEDALTAYRLQIQQAPGKEQADALNEALSEAKAMLPFRAIAKA